MGTVKQRLDRLERRRPRKQERLIVLLESGQGFTDGEKTYTPAEVGELAAAPANSVYLITRRPEGVTE